LAAKVEPKVRHSFSRRFTIRLALRRFTFTKLAEKAGTTNKKAVSKALDIAESHGLLRRDGKLYIVADPAAAGGA
jgi:hemin uptake protein HemP